MTTNTHVSDLEVGFFLLILNIFLLTSLVLFLRQMSHHDSFYCEYIIGRCLCSLIYICIYILINFITNFHIYSLLRISV